MTRTNFRLPAEWERQSATLLAWPHADSDWNSDLAAIQGEYLELVHAITRHQACALLIPPGNREAREKLGGRPGMHFLEAPYNDTWCRDYGPVTLVHGGERLALDFFFNGWGGKYPAALDNRVNTHLSRHELFNRITFRQYLFELEGGAMDCDGSGCLLVNWHNLRARHPYLDKREIEHELHTLLHTDKVIGIDLSPLPGDDTDGHIDTLARFIAPGKIAFQVQAERQRGDLLRGQLETLRDGEGRPFDLIALPALRDAEENLPANYANFLFVNDAVLMPAYGVDSDDEAAAVLSDALDGRPVEQVPARAMIRQSGGPHCASMQLPAALN